MGVTFRISGSTRNMERFLNNMRYLNVGRLLAPYGQQGVAALASATPVDSGLAAQSWGYEITSDSRGVAITWTNSDTENGFPVAVMLQYGHGTGTGGYVQGRDYINPAIRPVMDRIAEEVWRVVTSA